MSAFGDRLREVRGALSQAEFGRLGGVQRNAQAKYETGERSPDARYLEALAGQGIDVHYLVTGQVGGAAAAPVGLGERPRRFETAAPSAEEATLLRGFRRLSKADQATVLKLVASLGRG